MDILIRIARTGLRRGIRYGSRRWLITGITAGLLALVQRVLTQSPKTVYSTELKAGERLEIRTIPRNP
ncbi:MAG TPA: hypothetical protein VKC52_04875 [Acidimicrobiia bacterium]|jgi:hypothetical protein|nr:hypothetical protein [Acidimicrobiia bacterium]